MYCIGLLSSFWFVSIFLHFCCYIYIYMCVCVFLYLVLLYSCILNDIVFCAFVFFVVLLFFYHLVLCFMNRLFLCIFNIDFVFSSSCCGVVWHILSKSCDIVCFVYLCFVGVLLCLFLLICVWCIFEYFEVVLGTI